MKHKEWLMFIGSLVSSVVWIAMPILTGLSYVLEKLSFFKWIGTVCTIGVIVYFASLIYSRADE